MPRRIAAQRRSELDLAHQGADASGNRLMGTVRERAEDEAINVFARTCTIC